MPKERKWKDNEIQYVKDNYGLIDTNDIATHLNRTLKAIQRKAHRLNLKFPKPNIGDKFGRWTIIDKPYSVKHKNKFRFVAKVECSCKNKITKIIPLCYLISGKSKSCGCLRIELATNNLISVQKLNSTLFYDAHPANKGYKKLSLTKYNNIINGAISRNLEFDNKITIKYAYDLLNSQNWQCALTGIPITLKVRFSDSSDCDTASFDRINNLYGYILGNVRWVHKIINIIKWQYSDEFFINLCSDVALFNNNLEYYDYKFSNHGKLWKGFGDISQWYFNGLVNGAKERNILFDVSIDYLWELFLKQNARCALSGNKIYFGINYQTQTASLDRIDSNKGYILSNLQWINKYINKFKWRLSVEEFKYWCRLIYEYKNNIPNKINGL